MVWSSKGPQGAEAQKVMFEVAHLMHGRALDLGCGPSPAFAYAPNVIGIDNDRDWKLFGAKAAPKIPMSADRLALFADGEIDVVFSSHMLEHLDAWEDSLADWWRTLRVGGRLILYVPHRDWYPNIGMPGANPDHRVDLVPEDVTRAMERITDELGGGGWDCERDETRADGWEYSFLQIYRKRADSETRRYEAKPKPEKTLGIVRLGAYGDALWITPILKAYKDAGWHITLFTQKEGEASLRNDPNVDEIRVQPDRIFGEGNIAAQLQAAYWLHLEKQFDRFVNLVGSVERTLLPHPADPNFWLPDVTRRETMNRNYVANVFAWAGVPFEAKKARVKFTPTADELAFALARKAELGGGPLVVLNPAGSSVPKWWPHAQKAMDLLDAEGVATVLLGDLRGMRFRAPPRGRVIGTDWTIRQCYAFAALADVVIGTESAIINSVAFEAPLKIALLSHSTAEQLTRDWERTIAVEPEGLACYPCHRIHADWSYCTRAPSGAAACQDAASAETVVSWALQWIRGEMKEAA